MVTIVHIFTKLFNMSKVYILTANNSKGYKKIKRVFKSKDKANKAKEEAMKTYINQLDIHFAVEEFELEK